MIMRPSQVCRCRKSCKNAGDLSGRIWKTISMGYVTELAVLWQLDCGLLPWSWYSSQRRGDTWALGPPQPWVLHRLPSISSNAVSYYGEENPQDPQTKEGSCPCSVGKCSLLQWSPLPDLPHPDIHTLKNSYAFLHKPPTGLCFVVGSPVEIMYMKIPCAT